MIVKVFLLILFMLFLSSCGEVGSAGSAGSNFTIVSVSPTSGSTSGGTTITITGTGFLDGLTITIGGSDCANISVNSETEVTCDTPAGSTGSADLVMTMDGESVTSANAFSFGTPAPSITSISPTGHVVTQNTTLTITGSGFVTGATVTVDGISCSSANVVTGGSITCTTPKDSDGATAGAKDVVVQNPDSQSNTLSSGFIYRTALTFTALKAGVINTNCSGCHTGGGTSGGLDLDSHASTLSRVTAFDPDNSLLIDRLNGVGGVMPPGGAISASEIQEFSDWIADGAQDN